MSGQLSTHAEALRLFFTEDIYLLPDSVSFSKTADQGTAPVATVPDVSTPIAYPEVKKAAVAAPGYVTFEALGKNQKKILILVNDAANKVSTEKGSELLRNIVKAINLNANDFALVNYAQYPGATYAQLSTYFSSTLIFCFGISAADLQMEALPLNEISSLGAARVINCVNLEQLAEDQQSKKMLWGCLKKLNL